MRSKWKPKNAERYFFINDEAVIASCFWFACFSDRARFYFGNVFETYLEAGNKLKEIR